MLHKLILPDGRVIASGASGEAILSVKLTSSVAGDHADPGGVYASELDITLLGNGIGAGDVLRLEDEDGPVGIFIAQKPTFSSGRMRLLAYDSVTRLDRPADGFLETVTFPIALGDLARGLCGYFGLELKGTLLSADYLVPAFQARNITGRQLMQWICQAGCRYCRADREGALVLDWFADSGITLRPSGEAFYFSGMTHADFVAAPPDQVVLAQTEQDLGVACPEQGENPLRIVGNGLLTGDTQPVAQTLYDALSGLSHTPCTLTTTTPVPVGKRFTVETAEGSFTALAMTVERGGGVYRITGTGVAARGGSDGICRSDYRSLSGRVLNAERELSGVRTQLAEFSEATAKVSELSQDVDHITARVAVVETGQKALGQTLEELSQSADQQFAQLSLRSDAMELAVGSVRTAVDGKADAETVQTLTEHFRFDQQGLTISDSATGMGVVVSEEQVSFSGGSDPTTHITPTGMRTTNLSVEDTLELGDFALLPRTSGNLSLRWVGE